MSRIAVGLLSLATIGLAPLLHSSGATAAPNLRIAQFCSPVEGQYEELLIDLVSDTADALGDLPTTVSAIVAFDTRMSAPPVANLTTIYFVRAFGFGVIICNPGKVYPTDPRMGSEIELRRDGEAVIWEEEVGIVSFKVGTNCGTGCASVSDLLLVYSPRQVHEFYIVNTGNDSDLMLRVCPLNHTFRTEAIDLSHMTIQGTLSATIQCGDQSAARNGTSSCIIRLRDKLITIAAGEDVGLFSSTKLLQFSPLSSQHFAEFYEANERFLSYAFESEPYPLDLCEGLDGPPSPAELNAARDLGFTHLRFEGEEFPVTLPGQP